MDNRPPARRRRRHFVARRYGGDYSPVVAALVLLYLLVPLASASGDIVSVAIAAWLVIAVTLGVRGTTDDPRALRHIAVAAVATFALALASLALGGTALPIAANLAFAALFFALAVAITRDIMREPLISVDTVVGSAGVYLLLLYAWAALYASLLRADHAAFAGAIDADEPLTAFLYFSTVTQTTIGFGDITPASSVARALVGVQAISGQLYVAILIAWIVGRAVAQHGVPGDKGE
jgi:hypothetical protein